MKILSIIVTYNALNNNWLYKCIDSLEASTIKTDIFVVDNSSADETVAKIKEKYPSVILTASERNLGFAKANNIGFNYALENGYDFVFLLNQDAWLKSPSELQKLVEVSQLHDNAGLISPIHLSGTNNVFDRKFLQYLVRDGKEGIYLISDLCLQNIQKKYYEVDFVNAAAWLLPITTLLKVGAFDDVLFQHYGEDNNFVNRLHYHQLKLIVSPTSYIIHDRADEAHNDKFHKVFKNKFLEFNKKGANPMDSFRNKVMEKHISDEKSKMIENLFRLNYKKFRFYHVRYIKMKKQQKLINSRVKNY